MVFDTSGRLIRHLSDPENSSFLWDGKSMSGADVPSGVYLIHGIAGELTASIQVVKL
jgi:hypothetical protein